MRPRLGDAVAVPSIAVKGTETKTFTIPASETGTAGTLYYGACIAGSNPEKCSDAVTLTVTTAVPDLAVNSVKVTVSTAASYTMGGMVTLSVVVTNSGTANSTDGTVSFYRQMAGETNPTADGEAVATATIPAVNSGSTGNTATVTTDMFALGAAGTGVQYYAVVSGVTGETNSTNNTSMLSEGIVIVAPIPDLSIAKPTITGTTPYLEGDEITLSAVVTNSSTATGASTNGTVTFYREDGMTDTAVGTAQTLGTIAAGEMETVTTNHTLTAADVGTAVQYYAVISGVTNETNTANNTSDSTDGITIVELDPDLSITAFTVTPNPVIAGNMVTATVTVRNNGTTRAEATTASIELYNFGGSNIPLADTIMVDALDVDASNTFTGMITIPRNIGDVHTALNVRARVASVSGETNTGNNEFVLGGGTPMELDITARIVDLTPGKPIITTATTFTEGQMVTLSVDVTNNGNVGAPNNSGNVFFYRLRGARPNIATDAPSVGTFYVLNAIAVGATTTATTTFPLTDEDVGTNVRYYAYIAPISILGETNTDNNTSALSDGVTIAARNPDLEITSFTIENSVTSVAQGGIFTAEVVVRNNNGAAASTASTVSFALVDSTGMNPVSLAGTIMVPTITAGMSTSSLTGTITVPVATATGMYRLRATVAGSNNTSMLSESIAIVARTIDLDITAFITVGNVGAVTAGGMFDASVIVRNSGNTQSPMTTVSFDLVSSAGMVVQALDGTISIPTIPGGMSTSTLTGAVTVPIATTAATYRLRATVTAVEDESDRTDNTFLLGGDTPNNFMITAPRETMLNLASGCNVLIGSAEFCTANRTADLAMGEEIGTVLSTNATAFAIVGSNDDFAIDATSGVVTAKRAGTIASFNLPATFGIMVTGGVGAGIQRIRIINDENEAGEISSVGLVGAPIDEGSVTLFTPATSTARTYACNGQGGDCVTSYQTGSGTGNGWYSPYNTGVTATALDARDYGSIHIEYNLNNNTVSGTPPARFTVRLGYAYYDLTAGLVADSTWRTVSIPLTETPSRGNFVRQYLSRIGFYDQGEGVDLSIRTVYLR